MNALRKMLSDALRALAWLLDWPGRGARKLAVWVRGGGGPGEEQ